MSDRHNPSSSAESTTVIGKGIHIQGELTGSAPIEVWGSLEGVSGTEGRFWVREGGQVGGEIAAAEVIIEGQVEGKISAERKVEFRPTCRVKGNVAAKKVAIAEGAIFDGSIRMSGHGQGPGTGGGKGEPSGGKSSGPRGPENKGSGGPGRP